MPRINRSDSTSASLEIVEFSLLSFVPRRIYWMQNFIHGTTRGNHAHKTLNQAFVVIRGSLTVELSDGEIWEKHALSAESGYLSIQSGLWRVISEASTDAILLVLADQPYDESDYIRDWQTFLHWREDNV